MRSILLVSSLIFFCSTVMINAQRYSPRNIKLLERRPLDIHIYERMQSSYDDQIKRLQQDIIEIKARKEELRKRYKKIIDDRIERKNDEISRMQNEKKELESKKNKIMGRKVKRSESNIEKQIAPLNNEIGVLKDLKSKVDDMKH